MKVSAEEYNSLLYKINDPNLFTDLFKIPESNKEEEIYELDLNQRKVIKVPATLSVESDLNSEIIWFIADRFYDNFDLYDSNCWIQYINAKKEKYVYFAPIIIDEFHYGTEKILIPWVLSKEISAYAGTVEFSFQFFKIKTVGGERTNELQYVLNTTSSKSRVVSGLRVDPMEFIDDTKPSDFSAEQKSLANQLQELYDKFNELEKNYELYWSIVE